MDYMKYTNYGELVPFLEKVALLCSCYAIHQCAYVVSDGLTALLGRYSTHSQSKTDGQTDGQTFLKLYVGNVGIIQFAINRNHLF